MWTNGEILVVNTIDLLFVAQYIVTSFFSYYQTILYTIVLKAEQQVRPKGPDDGGCQSLPSRPPVACGFDGRMLKFGKVYNTPTQ